MATTLKFCGANRLRDLETLKERWKLASDVSNPSPQLVVIKAERGIGKTRLALEFYKWLSQNAEGASPGYWPDDLTHIDDMPEVNPDPEKCDMETKIPFLWWGIRPVERDMKMQARGDAVAAADHFVTPHLVALMVKATMKQAGIDFGKACAKLSVNFATLGMWENIVIASDILETAKILTGAAQDIDQKKALEGPVSHANAVLSDFEKVFNPKALTFAKTPGAILIDDAQFTHTDAALPSFIENLLHKAVTQKWPVMIIVTHWRAQFSTELSSTENSFVGILNHSRNANPKSFGPAANQPGGFLTDEHYHEIDIDKVDDLTEALQERLPGLTIEQTTALLAKTDGNPRYLEQLIKYAETKKSLFEAKKTENPLTDAGLGKLLDAARSTRIFDIVKLRLMDAPQEVQEAVCLASLQGMRFTSELVDALATARLGIARKEYIEIAENPYSFVTRSRRSLDEAIGQFVEGIFFQVADDLRPDLESFPDDDELKLSFRQALLDMLADDEFEASTSVESKLLIHGLAADMFEQSTDEDELISALRSLEALARLEFSRNAYEAAAAAHERQWEVKKKVKIDPSERTNEIGRHLFLANLYWTLEWPKKCSNALCWAMSMAFDLIGDNGAILGSAWTEDSARKYYEDWRQLRIEKYRQEGIIADDQEMGEVSQKLYLHTVKVLCHCFVRMSELARVWGNIASRDGDFQFLENAFMLKVDIKDDEGNSLEVRDIPSEAAADVYARWAYGLGSLLSDHTVRRDQLDVLSDYARNANRKGRPDLAKEYLIRSLEIVRPMGDAIEQIQILNDLGVVLGQSGDREGAYNSLGEAGDILNQLFSQTFEVSTPEENPEFFEQLGMGGGHDKIRFPTALGPLLEKDAVAAVRLFMKLLRLAGNVVGNLARANHEDGNLDNARFGYERAFQMHFDGNDPSGAATALFNLGSLLRDEGKIEEARENLEKALNIYEKLHDDNKNEFGLSKWLDYVERIQATIDTLPNKYLQ